PQPAHPDARRADPSAARSPTTGAATGAYPPSVKRIVELDAIVGEGGRFARALDNYRPRASQIDLARAVAAAMEASGKLRPEPE
ncbi:ATP-dependent DNA helicase, partial [Burkholderia pseudomallei]